MHCVVGIFRNQLLISFLIGLAGLSTVLTSSSEGKIAGDCQWTDDLSRLLGIEADPPLLAHERPQIVNAVVMEAEKISAAGLYGSRKGDKIKLICIGEATWRIKNYRTGLASTITVTPQSQ